jgi:hypothetical protein
VFPFSGLRSPGSESFPIPLVPIRVRERTGPWSIPFDAALDTGSTRTFLPKGLAGACSITSSEPPEEVDAPAASFEASPATVELAIMDSNYPEVSVWEIHGFRIWIPVRDDVVAVPVLGWDLLARFHICFDHGRQKIEMRLDRR